MAAGDRWTLLDGLREMLPKLQLHSTGMATLLRGDGVRTTMDKRVERVSTWLQQDFQAELQRNARDAALNLHHALSHPEQDELRCSTCTTAPIHDTATTSPMLNETFLVSPCLPSLCCQTPPAPCYLTL